MNYFISSSDTAFCFLVRKNKINLKGQILILDGTSFFLWQKDTRQFMLCIRDQNLAPSLHDGWICI